MKYTSTNIFLDFEFHDAHFEFVSFENNNLIISAKHVNLHKDTEQNPTDTDMEIELAEITFENFKTKSLEPLRAYKQDENGNLYTDDEEILYEGEEALEILLEELRFGIEVFELGKAENSTPYFEGSGKLHFSVVKFSFDTARIEWNEFKCPAWYEDEKFKKQRN